MNNFIISNHFCILLKKTKINTKKINQVNQVYN